MYQFGLALLLGSILVAVAGCGGAKIEPPKLPHPKVTVITPVSYPVRDYWHYNGYLDTTESVEVRSKIRGFIAKVEFKEGTEVQEGDLLYRIERVEYETARNKAKAELDRAEADIKNLEAQIKLAKADRDRYAEAVQRGVEARPELDRAQATYDVRVAEHRAAIAARDAAEAALKTAEIQLNYTDIRAKISGRISRTLVNKGNLIQADTTLLTTIVRVDELFVYFDAPESDLIAYQRTQISRLPLRAGVLLARMLMGQGFSEVGSIPVEVGLPGEEGYPHVGYIDFRENRIETSTGTIRIRGRIDNPPVNGIRLLFPGMYARIRVPKGDPYPQLTLTEDCLMTGQEGRFV
jgi:multidrug efflux system membrane fusion protein